MIYCLKSNFITERSFFLADVRFYVADSAGIALWPSTGKYLFPWLFAFVVYFNAVVAVYFCLVSGAKVAQICS